MNTSALREKSSQSDRIHFVALRDEKNHMVCLMPCNGEVN